MKLRWIPWVAILLISTLSHAGDAEVPAFFELRVYAVSSNKMDGVLDRFRDTVDPVRRRIGIRTVGYWTAPGITNGGTFVYLMAAPSREELQRQEKEFGSDPQFREGFAASNRKHGRTVDEIITLPLKVDKTAVMSLVRDPDPAAKPRVFDLRIYSVLPGKLEAFRNRWRDYAVPIYQRHGLPCLGWWIAEKKDLDGNDQFVCLLAGESLEAIQKSINDFHKDPEWIRVERESEAAGKLRSGVKALKLTPTDFSGLR